MDQSTIGSVGGNGGGTYYFYGGAPPVVIPSGQTICSGAVPPAPAIPDAAPPRESWMSDADYDRFCRQSEAQEG